MTAKEFLNLYRDAFVTIKTLERQREELAELRDATAPTGDGSGTGGGLSDKTGRIASLIADLDLELQAYTHEAERLRVRILRAVLGIPDDQQRDVIYQRYIMLQTWERVADVLKISRRHCFDLEADALEYLAERHGLTR